MPRYFSKGLPVRTGRRRTPFPSFSNSSSSPGRTPKAARISWGTVIRPLLVICACFFSPNSPFPYLPHYSLLMEVQSLPENVPLALAFRFSLVHLQHRRGTRDEDNKENGGFRLGSEAPRQPSRVWGQGVLFSLGKKGRIGSAGPYITHKLRAVNQTVRLDACVRKKALDARNAIPYGYA